MAFNIPLEILKGIFMRIKSLDDLVRLQIISKHWNIIIEKFLSLINWKELCSKEIKKFSLLSLISVISPELKITDYREISDQSFWQKLYYHYQKWQNFKKSSSLSYSLKNRIPFAKNKHITCCDVWYDSMACGTSHGKIYIFVSPYYQHTHSIIKHDKVAIKQVKFWYNGNGILHLVSLTKSRKLGIWNMNNGQQDNIEPLYLTNKICTGTAHNFYVGCGNRVIKYELTDTNKVSMSLIRGLPLYGDEIIDAMYSLESLILIATRRQLTLRLFAIEDPSIKGTEDTLYSVLISELPLLPPITSKIQTYITSNRTVICAQKKIINAMFSNLTWIPYIASKQSKVYVNCLIIHANYLIIGLTNGDLRLQYLEDTFDLLELSSPNQNPAQIIKISSKPIVDIKVVQNHDDINIVVISESEIFILKI